jgi:hypothetical protein
MENTNVKKYSHDVFVVGLVRHFSLVDVDGGYEDGWESDVETEGNC